MQIKSGFVSVHDARIYFEVMGTGKPLLLLHSGIADHRMWAEQCHIFSKYFQVLTPDFRGYGKSSIPHENFWHYKDIYEFIKHLKFKAVNVVGCSLGGKSAMELAIAHPEVVDRLVLVAPGLPGYEYQDKETLAKDTILEKLIADDRREEVADILTDIWLVGLKRGRKEVGSNARKLVVKMILDNYDSVVDKFPEAKSEFDVISRLGEIRTPTLVMIGDSDLPDMQAIAQLITGKIPGTERQLIPNTAHLPNLEHPEIFNQAVIKFLS